MPNYKRITADSPPRPSDNPAELFKQLASARKELETFQVKRYELRLVRDKEGLADCSDDFAAVINEVAELEKRYSRVTAEGPVGETNVAVGTAGEGETNG